jgi:hypothetical protein
MQRQEDSDSSVVRLVRLLDADRVKADVYSIGVGVYQARHLTLECLATIADCKKAFGFFDVIWLAPALREIGVEFSQLDYPPVLSRKEIFATVANIIASAALQSPPVCWLTSGSPVRYVWITQLMRDWAKREGLTFRTVLAPSSLDALLDFLQINDSQGLQVYDAKSLLLGLHRPSNSLYSFVYNLEIAGTERSPVGSRPRKQMLLPLKEWLMRIYPPSHTVTFALIGGCESASRRFDISLDKMENAADLPVLGTLCLPPVLEFRPASRETEELDQLTRLVRVAHTPLDALLGDAARNLAIHFKRSSR